MSAQAEPLLSGVDAYRLGWQAAAAQERREWVEQYGPEALRGFDAWEKLRNPGPE